MAAALRVPLLAGQTAGVSVCPKTGVAVAAANVTNNSNSRRCTLMAPSLSRFDSLNCHNLGFHPLCPMYFVGQNSCINWNSHNEPSITAHVRDDGGVGRPWPGLLSFEP